LVTIAVGICVGVKKAQKVVSINLGYHQALDVKNNTRGVKKLKRLFCCQRNETKSYQIYFYKEISKVYY